jgi:16S rRNA processing protein RimM
MSELSWVVLGVVGAPFGLEGWVHIQPFTAEAENILNYKTLWLQKGGYEVPLTLQHTRVQSGGVVAKWLGCDDREKAMTYRGAQLVVPRDALPEVESDSFYWVDLEGCEVIEQNQQQSLGQVAFLYESSQDTMVVRRGTPDGRTTDQHIPFIMDEVVLKVDLSEKRIWVDWPFDVACLDRDD